MRLEMISNLLLVSILYLIFLICFYIVVSSRSIVNVLFNFIRFPTVFLYHCFYSIYISIYVCLVFMCFFFQACYSYTGARHTLAHGTTTQNSRGYLVSYIYACMWSLSIHVISLVLCRHYIYHVYSCAALPLYILFYILHP